MPLTTTATDPLDELERDRRLPARRRRGWRSSTETSLARVALGIGGGGGGGAGGGIPSGLASGASGALGKGALITAAAPIIAAGAGAATAVAGSAGVAQVNAQIEAKLADT